MKKLGEKHLGKLLRQDISTSLGNVDFYPNCRCDGMSKLIKKMVEYNGEDHISLICNACNHANVQGDCIDFDKYCEPCSFEIKEIVQ